MKAVGCNVGGQNPALAEEIAQDHSKQCKLLSYVLGCNMYIVYLVCACKKRGGALV